MIRTVQQPGGSGGNHSISFAQVASGEPDASELVERKACEGGCGGWFYRPLPKSAREGEKLCPKCRVKTLEQMALDAGLLAQDVHEAQREKMRKIGRFRARERAA